MVAAHVEIFHGKSLMSSGAIQGGFQGGCNATTPNCVSPDCGRLIEGERVIIVLSGCIDIATAKRAYMFEAVRASNPCCPSPA